MAHNLYSGFAIQNTFMSTVVLINEVSEVFSIATSLSPKWYSANIPLDFCTTAECRLWDQIFFNEDTAGVLGNI